MGGGKEGVFAMTAPERLAKAPRMIPDVVGNVRWSIHMYAMFKRCA